MNTKQLHPIWKIIFICAFTLFALTLAGITLVVSMYLLDERGFYVRKHERIMYLNENIEIKKINKGNTCYERTFNRLTGKPISDKFLRYASCCAEGDSLVVYTDMENKRGYLNLNTGEFAIKGTYKHAWNFSEGLGAVVVDGKVGFINPQGEIVLPCAFSVSYNAIHHYGFAFHDGLCVMTDSTDLCGLINRQGEWVLQPKYERIWNPNKAHQRIYQDNGKYGVMNNEGKVLLPAQYDYIYDKKGHYQVVKEGIMSTLDYNLKLINPFVTTKTEPEFLALDEDVEVVTEFVKYHIYDKEGLLDHNGKVIIPAKYAHVQIVASNLFKASVSNSNEWVFYDINGNMITHK